MRGRVRGEGFLWSEAGRKVTAGRRCREREKQEGWQRRMGTQREGWGRDGRRYCDRWVVPGQSWEGAERLASQGENTHTHTHVQCAS